MWRARMTRSELKIQKFQPLPHAEQRDRQCQRGRERPRRIRPPSQQTGLLRRATVFAITEKLRDVRQAERDRQRDRARRINAAVLWTPRPAFSTAGPAR